jgi:hypothetical protein
MLFEGPSSDIHTVIERMNMRCEICIRRTGGNVKRNVKYTDVSQVATYSEMEP